MNDDPIVLSIQHVREALLRDVMIPPELVSKALRVVESKLEATETKFFSWKGRVTDTRQVADHATQLAAADKIFSMAGVYHREREATPQQTQVMVETSPTGVVRLIMGSNVAALPQSKVPSLEATPVDYADPNILDVILGTRASDPTTLAPVSGRLKIPDNVMKIILDEEVTE